MKIKKGPINEIQRDIWHWKCKNFPNSNADEQFLGIVEEVGEAAHAILKQKQRIRGTWDQHEEDLRDAIGDIMIFLFNFCSENEWYLSDIIQETWDVVKKRDWEKHKGDGVNG
jgi:NTP pyrophosphatase (non-canonical NTP hydrolase)